MSLSQSMELKAVVIVQVIVLCAAVWIEQNETCYWLSENQATFSEAEQSCMAMGSSMLTDETDVKLIIGKFEENLEYWLNAAYNGSDFNWVSGGHIDESHWIPGDPNGDGPCVRYRSYGNWIQHILGDISCDSNFNYVCVKTPWRVTYLSKKLLTSPWDSLCLITTKVMWSQLSCAILCSLDADCGVFNYDVTNLNCDLLSLNTSNCQVTNFTGKPVFDLIRDNYCL